MKKKIVPKAASEFLHVPDFLSSTIGRFSQVSTPRWMQQNSTKTYVAQAAFGTDFIITAGFQNNRWIHRRLSNSRTTALTQKVLIDFKDLKKAMYLVPHSLVTHWLHTFFYTWTVF